MVIEKKYDDKKAVEKLIYSKACNTGDVSKKKKVDVRRFDNFLTIQGKRWSEEYGQYALKPTSKFSTLFGEGAYIVLNTIRAAIRELSDIKVTAEDNGKEILDAYIINPKGEKFRIVGKVGNDTKVKVFYVIESEGGKDIIPLEDNTGLEVYEGVDPYYIIELERFEAKLENFINSFEAQDKFTTKMFNSDKDKKPVESTPAKDDIDDFGF